MPNTRNELKLPNELLIFENQDKQGWYDTYDPSKPAKLPHPFRACLMAGVGSGKTSLIKNLVLRQSFERIYLLHLDVADGDADGSCEYADLNCEILTEVPDPRSFDKRERNLLIMEEISPKDLSKAEQKRLDRMLGYASTHRNLSVIITAQNPISVPISLRRMCSHLFLWQSSDNIVLRIFGERLHMEPRELAYLIKTHCHTPYDFLCIATGGNGEPFIRKNLFEVIKQDRRD